MNNRDYWRKRSEHRETVSSEHAKQAEQVLAYNYRKAASQMRKEINDFYKRYEGENGLTYAEAVREMNRAELREWRGSVCEIVDIPPLFVNIRKHRRNINLRLNGINAAVAVNLDSKALLKLPNELRKVCAAVVFQHINELRDIPQNIFRNACLPVD